MPAFFLNSVQLHKAGKKIRPQGDLTSFAPQADFASAKSTGAPVGLRRFEGSRRSPEVAAFSERAPRLPFKSRE